MDNTDYRRFQSLLYLANSILPIHFDHIKPRGRTSPDIYLLQRKNLLVEVCAYTMMPNHFHILVKEKVEGGISHFIQKLSTAYTMYFNKKNGRNGVLFQGKYKIVHVDNDQYLKYLVSYIHLNPIKLIEPTWKETGIKDRAKAKEYLATFPYSSYPDFLGEQRPEKAIISTQSLPIYFNTTKDFEAEVTDWLSYEK
ncbi:transposase [Patescibacteria group bacterium]|nr:transposase [Patescibacteria group bacterium]